MEQFADLLKACIMLASKGESFLEVLSQHFFPACRDVLLAILDNIAGGTSLGGC